MLGASTAAPASGKFYRCYGNAFAREKVLSSFVATCLQSSVLGSSSRYQRLLDALFQPAFSVPSPSTTQISIFLSLFSPCTLGIVLDHHAKYTRASSRAASTSSSSSTWPDPATVPLDPVQAMWDVDVDIFGPDAAGTVANEEGATGEDDGREEEVEKDEEETGGGEEVEEDEEETGSGEGGLGVEDAAGVDDEEADEEKDDSNLEEMLDGSLS